MSRPLLCRPRSFSGEAAEIEAVEWVASPSESVVHLRLPGAGGLVCGHELADEPESCTGYLPAARWPRYQAHLACLASAPAWVGDLVEPRPPRPYMEESVLGRHAIETVSTLRMPNLVRHIKALEFSMTGPPARTGTENVPGSSYLPGTCRESSGISVVECSTLHELGEVA
ncbi:hypothetical protein [Saccharopolyspora sp. ASAGF58]|uniref:hypothetical protein n=1 Tax=Saccharopolyspora sp. ASAGF58 TaxID=2719023 RepID=UPI0014400929|nr:hypothetical protein [Saccharopolyspora sp. ASAGF58]QIZ37220.1 hypothetical protein FDZ84_24580 [Saccharopolyspora sp. ASAGF58]